MTAHGLIDTTEMYLRTVYELEEEGIVPLRARIAERLAQSVSPQKCAELHLKLHEALKNIEQNVSLKLITHSLGLGW